MKQAQAPSTKSAQKSASQKPKAKSKVGSKSNKPPSKQQKATSTPMIATASANMAPDTSSLLGGIWIDAPSSGSNGTDVDVDTVISEITHDLTAFAADSAKKPVSKPTTSKPDNKPPVANADALMEELLNCLNGATGRATPAKAAGIKKKAPTTPSTAQSTPDRPVKAAPAAAKKRTSKSSDSVAITNKSLSTAGSATATATGATASTTTTAKQSTKVKPPATPTPQKKKAPTMGMDVSPNPHVRKPKPAPTTAASAVPKPPKAAPKTTGMAMMKTPPPTTATTTSPNNNSNNLGLSELSKQLRVQRAKNEWQHQEIARLERQIRILSDLKGVSVADLRFSLESACQEEAHGELRNQVQSLQAQLEALQTQRDATRRRASTATTEAAQSKIATLQLRIGELEEVDHAKQAELQGLYQQLQGQSQKTTTLQTTNDQLAGRLQQFENIAKQYIQDLEGITGERDTLRQQVAALSQQLHDQKHQQELAQAMKNIEDELDKEKKRKQAYLNQARQQHQQQQQQQHSANARGPAVNNRLSGSQLAAIQGVVGRQAGVPVMSPRAGDAATIATNVIPDDVMSLSTASQSVSVVPSNPFEGLEDDVSHLGADDMSVHTFDALMMNGLSEEQAKEALAKDAKITELYEELRGHATKASQLQTLCANQKMHLDRFAQELNEKQGLLKSTQNNYNFAKSEHDSLYQRFCDVELQLRVEQEKVEGLERNLNARVNESQLRDEQMKCRFQVQTERIADLEQQQQSLYAAFQLLQQEVRAQDSEHKTLKSSLDEADSEVARQLRESEVGGNDRRSSLSSPMDMSSQRNVVSSQRNVFDVPSSGGEYGGDFSTVTATEVSPYADMHESTSSLYVPTELTPQQQGIDHPMQMYGYLWKLDKIKGWKRRFFALYGEGGVYQMTYSDGPKERVKGTISNITMGVSTVAETNKSIKKPFSFVLHVDPLRHGAPVLYAAAPDAANFNKWMSALKAATIRPEDSMFMSQANLSAEAQVEADMEVARQMSVGDLNYNSSANDADAQIEADHLMAMRLSIQNQPNQAYA